LCVATLIVFAKRQNSLSDAHLRTAGSILDCKDNTFI